MSKNGPILFVVRASPNESAGTPIILRRLLENFSADEVVVLSRKAKKFRALERNFSYPVVETFAPEVKGRKVIALFTGLFTGLWVIRKYKPRAIVGVYPDDGALLLAYWLHRLTGLRLFGYFCDLYMENKKGIERKLAQWLQPKVFERSGRILCVNEGMRDFYGTRYGLDAALLPTAINKEFPKDFNIPEIKGKMIIGYSGNISRDRIQPFRELVKLVRARNDIELRFLVPHDKEYLQERDLWVEGSVIKFCKNDDELIHELTQCHLLYLPLTFEVSEESEEQLATCFGIKSYEYILACRPVLVHCPSRYFTYRFFSEADAGVLAGELSMTFLESTVNDFRATYDQTAPLLVKNALKKAESFKGSVIKHRFKDVTSDAISR